MIPPTPSLLSITALLLLLPAAVQVAAAPAAANLDTTTRDVTADVPATAAILEARATKVGGVDMVALCHEQWGPEWRALLFGDSANDWKCWYALINYAGAVSVDAYCKKHYGGNTYASAPGGGKYDWGCYRN